MTLLSEELEMALYQERDIRQLAELDTGLVDRARTRINELEEGIPERDILIDLLVDLNLLRIDKMVRLAYRDTVQDQLPDLTGALEPEIELYLAVRDALQRCANQLNVDLREDGE